MTSGSLQVSRALQARFESITVAELARLDGKLRTLADGDRRSVEALTAEVIAAIARMPERALHAGASQPALDALIHLFRLDCSPPPAQPAP